MIEYSSRHRITRRTTLKTVGTALTGTSAALAGCVGGDDPPELEPTLEVAEARWGLRWTGDIDVTVRIRNTTDSRATGELFAELYVRDGTHQASKTISVAGDSEQAFTVTVDTPIGDTITGVAEDDIDGNVWIEE